MTAVRWGRILRDLGHRVAITTPEKSGSADLLVALHARRSGDAIASFREKFPERPIVVALTGTDVYRDLPDDETAQRSLELASRIVTLQQNAIDVIPAAHRSKARVIHQSARPRPARRSRPKRTIRLALVGHLREEKDPFRAVEALRLLSGHSRLRILHAGRALDAAMGERARQVSDERYRWLGELPAWKTRDLIAASHALLLTSVIEGGANVLSEAIVDHVPVLASRIPSSEAILGQRYPGFFAAGDARSLADLLERFDNDDGFRVTLQRQIEQIAPLFDPLLEKKQWSSLLFELL